MSLIPSVAIWKPESFPSALLFSPPKPHPPHLKSSEIDHGNDGGNDGGYDENGHRNGTKSAEHMHNADARNNHGNSDHNQGDHVLPAWLQPSTTTTATATATAMAMDVDTDADLASYAFKLKTQLDILLRDKHRDTELVASLRQEVGGLTGRLAATIAEHREQRNQWLREKVEMESRNCQLLALHTQLNARNIKKEKDYEKLQVRVIGCRGGVVLYWGLCGCVLCG